MKLRLIAVAGTATLAAAFLMAAAPAPAPGPAPAVAVQPEVAPGAYQELPPVRLYPNGDSAFRNWPGQLAGATEVLQGAAGTNSIYYNVSDPSYTAFIPVAGRNTRTAVIVAPGGGFRMLSWDSEGVLVAKWLAERGVAAFVLKYRLVQQAGPTYSSSARNTEPALTAAGTFSNRNDGEPAVADGTAAIRMIRARAAEYAIDTNKIVFMGFSAGAHVAAYQALNPDVAARANYVAPIYGAPAGTPMPAIPPANGPNPLPPIFMAIAQGDPLATNMTNNFYDALMAAGYRPEIHRFMDGGHGFGMRQSRSDSRHFIDELFWWMEAQGLTRKPGDPAPPAPRGGGAGPAGAGRRGGAPTPTP